MLLLELLANRPIPACMIRVTPDDGTIVQLFRYVISALNFAPGMVYLLAFLVFVCAVQNKTGVGWWWREQFNGRWWKSKLDCITFLLVYPKFVGLGKKTRRILHQLMCGCRRFGSERWTGWRGRWRRRWPGSCWCRASCRRLPTCWRICRPSCQLMLALGPLFVCLSYNNATAVFLLSCTFVAMFQCGVLARLGRLKKLVLGKFHSGQVQPEQAQVVVHLQPMNVESGWYLVIESLQFVVIAVKHNII